MPTRRQLPTTLKRSAEEEDLPEVSQKILFCVDDEIHYGYVEKRTREEEGEDGYTKEDAMEIQSPWVRAGKTGDRYPLAEYLGVSPKQAEKIRQALKGKEHHIGRVVIFAKADVDEYIDTHCF